MPFVQSPTSQKPFLCSIVEDPPYKLLSRSRTLSFARGRTIAVDEIDCGNAPFEEVCTLANDYPTFSQVNVCWNGAVSTCQGGDSGVWAMRERTYCNLERYYDHHPGAKDTRGANWSLQSQVLFL